MSSTAEARPGRVRNAVVWTLSVVETLAIGLAGLAKFMNPGTWTALFEGWGYPTWFTFVVGGTELVAALLLLVPRLSSYAAALLIVIMVGALGTVLTHPGNLGPVAPTVHVAMLSAILAARWTSRWRRGTA